MSTQLQSYRFSKPRWFLAGFFLVHSIPVFAETCPTKADLDTGIVFERTLRNSIMNRLVQRQDGDVFLLANDKPVNPSFGQIQEKSFMGIFVLEQTKHDGSLVRKYSYDYDLKSIFPLKVGDTHEISAVLTTPKGSTDVTITFEVEGQKKAHIGQCTYDTFIVKTREPRKNLETGELIGLHQSRYLYAPEIAFRFGPIVKKTPFYLARKKTAADTFPD